MFYTLQLLSKVDQEIRQPLVQLFKQAIEVEDKKQVHGKVAENLLQILMCFSNLTNFNSDLNAIILGYLSSPSAKEDGLRELVNPLLTRGYDDLSSWKAEFRKVMNQLNQEKHAELALLLALYVLAAYIRNELKIPILFFNAKNASLSKSEAEKLCLDYFSAIQLQLTPQNTVNLSAEISRELMGFVYSKLVIHGFKQFSLENICSIKFNAIAMNLTLGLTYGDFTSRECSAENADAIVSLALIGSNKFDAKIKSIKGEPDSYSDVHIAQLCQMDIAFCQEFFSHKPVSFFIKVQHGSYSQNCRVVNHYGIGAVEFEPISPTGEPVEPTFSELSPTVIEQERIYRESWAIQKAHEADVAEKQAQRESEKDLLDFTPVTPGTPLEVRQQREVAKLFARTESLGYLPDGWKNHRGHVRSTSGSSISTISSSTHFSRTNSTMSSLASTRSFRTYSTGSSGTTIFTPLEMPSHHRGMASLSDMTLSPFVRSPTPEEDAIGSRSDFEPKI